MGSSSSRHSRLAAEQRCVLADAVERGAAEAVAAWAVGAAALLRDELWRAAEVTVEELVEVATQAVASVSSRLVAGPAPARRCCEKGRRRALSEPGPLAWGALAPALGYCLHTQLAECLWQAVVPRLPAEWPPTMVAAAEHDLLAALILALGAAPVAHVLSLESALRHSREDSSAICKLMLAAHEQERERMAHEVHDTLAQALAGARYRTDAARRLLGADPAAAATEVGEAQQLIEHALSHARDISFDLRPVALNRFGLCAALDDYAARVRRTGVADVALEGCGNTRRLDPGTETFLFRIVQAAVGAVLVPLGTHHVTVQMSVASDHVALVVAGDDVVLEPDGNDRPGASALRLALLMMQKRAEAAGASLTIETNEERGSRIEVRAPVPIGGV